MDWKHCSFLVQAIDRDYVNADGSYAEGRVLSSLTNWWWGVGEPNGNCIHEKGPDKGLICDKNGFLLPIPVGTSKGLEDVDQWRHLGEGRGGNCPPQEKSCPPPRKRRGVKPPVNFFLNCRQKKFLEKFFKKNSKKKKMSSQNRLKRMLKKSCHRLFLRGPVDRWLG